MKQINMNFWLWARIMLVIAIGIAFFNRSDDSKVDDKNERLQWSGVAQYWFSNQETLESSNHNRGVIPELIVDPLEPNSRLQLSLRLKPIGSHDSNEVHPVGSGVLIHGNQKISILIDSNSMIFKDKLIDGSVFLHGSIEAILAIKSKQTNVTLEIEGLMDSDEFEVRYPYTKQEGVLVFGNRIHSHHNEIAELKQQ